MAEEQQITKEPQHVTAKEPQQVTTKNPNKVKAGERLAEYNCRKREKKAQTTERGAARELNQYYSCGSDRWSWLLHLSNQKRYCNQRSQGCFNAT